MLLISILLMENKNSVTLKWYFRWTNYHTTLKKHHCIALWAVKRWFSISKSEALPVYCSFTVHIFEHKNLNCWLLYRILPFVLTNEHSLNQAILLEINRRKTKLLYWIWLHKHIFSIFTGILMIRKFKNTHPDFMSRRTSDPAISTNRRRFSLAQK